MWKKTIWTRAVVKPFVAIGVTSPPSSPTKGQALLGTQEDVPEELATLLSSIETVDKFQGSERKVVMVSTCVDFKPLRAADPHLINVACSRAQHLLIVVGNISGALAENDDWKYVWDKSKELGSCMDHRVKMMDPDDDDGFDIHEEKLKHKSRALLEEGGIKRKRG